MSQEKITPFPVRLPKDLRKYLAHSAVDNDRSLSREIIFRLKRSVEADQTKATQ